ncbi:MAG: homoserine kinase [Clostridia bacterium]|nr:homoserine kinase [Clostridia bacterium]
MIKIKVPATTANVGPGFDTIGIALDLYNTITVKKESEKREFLWPDGSEPFPPKENLILQSCQYMLDKHPDINIGFSIQMDECNIPISRGLGSSAAAIVSGLYAANYLLDNRYAKEEIINFATELEGHPDNVVPAILGGMVISTTENESVLFSSVTFPDDLIFNVMIPDFKLSTSLARSVLPDSYSRKDCIMNISRVSLLINSLVTKDYEKIRPSLQDVIHQPYRLALINDGGSIMEKSKSLHAVGEFISGAGPTLIALTQDSGKHFKEAMSQYLSNLSDDWRLEQVRISLDGTTSEVIYE